ncbi:MAG: nucleoside triphosphate pyrophosphohydrolase [Bacillota bacterium]
MYYDDLSEEFINLVKIMEKLRGPEGCPWDKKQDYFSLKEYILEEAYEVVGALEEKNLSNFKEELGDLLLQVVFESQIAREKNDFDLKDVIEGINAKLINRHPHVFDNLKLNNAKEVKKTWDKIKNEEKNNKEKRSEIENYDQSQSALNQAYEIQAKARKLGFDWDDTKDVIAKVEEELLEVKEAIKKNNIEEIKDEIGDMLFSIVNLARFFEVNPELALFSTILKFKNRFKFMEREVERNNEKFSELNLETLDKYWEKSKLTEEE